MKKQLLATFIGLVASLSALAQNPDSLRRSVQNASSEIGHGGKHEVKLNLLMTVLGAPEISYEYLLSDNTGLGASFIFGLADDVDINVGIMPQFRVYFGSKRANGFFIEANSVIQSYKGDRFVFLNDYTTYMSRSSHTNFGLGAGVGGKFLTRNGFLGEVSFSVGRLFGQNRLDDAYGRAGITIGKRF